MYTQTSRITGPPGADGQHRLAPVENGPTVRILSQGGDHRVTIADADGEVSAMPSSEFFATHREAYPAEVEAFENPPALRVGKNKATAET